MDIQTTLSKVAESDMRYARKDGEMAITDTQYGTVFLSYNASDRTYRIMAGDRCLGQGKKGSVKPLLMHCYVIADDEKDFATA